MKKAWLCAFLILLLSFSFLSCSDDSGDDDDDDNDTGDGGDDDTGDDDNDTEPAPCDDSVTPIVFVHGFLENGDAFSHQTMRFASNGYCADRIFAFDWNSFGGNADAAELLAPYIDEVLAVTGALQVELLGHSAGGGISLEYLRDTENTTKVAHYVHVASFSVDDVPGGVPIVNLSSHGDAIFGATELAGAQNIVFDTLDHLQLATSPETFSEMYKFFNDGQEPGTTDILPQDDPVINGQVLTIAENAPAASVEMKIYPVDVTTGERLSEIPEATFVTGNDGAWGPFFARPGVYYEFWLQDLARNWQPLHYYREPFVRSNNKAHFRWFPEPASPLGFVFGIVPFDDSYALFAWLSTGRAVVAGRDTFTVSGYDLAATAIADPVATTIAAFFFDANFNGQSDAIAMGGVFASFPFIRVFDLLIAAEPPQPIYYQFNGRPLTIRNWPSDTEGLSIAMFD